jgi:hypothetical protein
MGQRTADPTVDFIVYAYKGHDRQERDRVRRVLSAAGIGSLPGWRPLTDIHYVLVRQRDAKAARKALSA